MDAVVAPLTRREVPQAARLLRQAFAADGILTAYLGGPFGSVCRGAFFRSVLHRQVAAQTVLGLRFGSGEVVGVAVWASPDGPSRDLVGRTMSAFDAALVAVVCPRGRRALMTGFDRLNAAHPPVPHWHLLFIGVDQRWRGHAVGTRLMADALTVIDEQDGVCYLETPFENTIAFYEQFGFRVQSHETPFPGLRALHTMVRGPHT